MTEIVRSDGYDFVHLKQAVFGVVKGRFPDAPVSADAIAQWVISANDYVDSRLCYTMGKMETVTVADQGNYSVWDSPALIRDVTCDGKLLEEISFHEYLLRMSTTTSQTVVAYYARYGAELYLWPNPTTSGQAIVVYLHQSPPLLQVDTDFPAVPPEVHPAIIDYALYLAFSHLPGQEQAASYHLQQFEAQMLRMETLAQNERLSLRVEPPTERLSGDY
jgi:hypothetical protein